MCEAQRSLPCWKGTSIFRVCIYLRSFPASRLLHVHSFPDIHIRPPPLDCPLFSPYWSSFEANVLIQVSEFRIDHQTRSSILQNFGTSADESRTRDFQHFVQENCGDQFAMHVVARLKAHVKEYYIFLSDTMRRCFCSIRVFDLYFRSIIHEWRVLSFYDRSVLGLDSSTLCFHTASLTPSINNSDTAFCRLLRFAGAFLLPKTIFCPQCKLLLSNFTFPAKLIVAINSSC